MLSVACGKTVTPTGPDAATSPDVSGVVVSPLGFPVQAATVVATNIQAGGPFIGPYLANFLVGGTDFGATTLSRFYAIHMLLIPGAIIALIGFHLYLVAKLGTTAPPYMKPHENGDLEPQTEV